MFTVGESVIDIRSNRVVLVVEVHELWGMTTCKVIDMTSNNVYSVNAENLAASGAACATSPPPSSASPPASPQTDRACSADPEP